MKLSIKVGNEPNVSGVKNARISRYNGESYVFTHRNPHTGELWSDDIGTLVGGNLVFGRWVPSDQVEFAM